MSDQPAVAEPTVRQPASTFLNYKGDQTRSDLLGKLLGPTYRSNTECLRVVSVEYHPATDRTRVGCIYVQRQLGPLQEALLGVAQ